MKQMILIGGGEVFEDKIAYYDFLNNFVELDFPGNGHWKDRILQAASLEYNTTKPQMPASRRADYRAWEIWFNKLLGGLKGDEYVLIGYSLGAMFLMRYLSENSLDGIKQLHLVSGGLYDSGYEGFCVNPENYGVIAIQCEKIFIYHSQDDSIVDFSHGERVAKALPSAKFERFRARGHFFQPAFPELLDNIGIYTR